MKDAAPTDRPETTNEFAQEWGSDHEAVPVMHLNRPILSSAITMGVGGITTVHQVGLGSVRLEGVDVSGCNSGVTTGGPRALAMNLPRGARERGP